MSLDVQSRMAYVGDTICYLSIPRLHYQRRACPSTGTARLEGVESRATRRGLQVPQWRKCDAPAAPRCLEPHLATRCPGTKVHTC